MTLSSCWFNRQLRTKHNKKIDFVVKHLPRHQQKAKKKRATQEIFFSFWIIILDLNCLFCRMVTKAMKWQKVSGMWLSNLHKFSLNYLVVLLETIRPVSFFFSLIRNMFCPSNETLQQLTEQTKLIAQKCSQQMRTTSMDQADVSSCCDVPRQQVATFKSYIDEAENVDGAVTVDFPAVASSPLNCLTMNLSSLNRLIKNRCSFMSTASYTCSTFPRKKVRKATAKWFIKVSL